MAVKVKSEKWWARHYETLASEAFHKVGLNRQFNIFDLSKISKAGIEAAKANQDVEAAVSAACDKYEIKS